MHPLQTDGEFKGVLKRITLADRINNALAEAARDYVATKIYRDMRKARQAGNRSMYMALSATINSQYGKMADNISSQRVMILDKMHSDACEKRSLKDISDAIKNGNCASYYPELVKYEDRRYIPLPINHYIGPIITDLHSSACYPMGVPEPRRWSPWVDDTVRKHTPDDFRQLMMMDPWLALKDDAVPKFVEMRNRLAKSPMEPAEAYAKWLLKPGNKGKSYDFFERDYMYNAEYGTA